MHLLVFNCSDLYFIQIFLFGCPVGSAGTLCCCTIGAADSILSHLSQCMSAVNFIPVFDFISEPALRSYFTPDALIFALVPQ